jgi:uncharacterized repeat protein (TIGR01451 family)
MLTSRPGLIGILVLAALLIPATAYAQSASLSVGLAFTSGTPIAGGNLTFEVTANNEGPDPALTTVLTFDVPTNSTFVSLVTPAGWSCTPLSPGATGTITCTTPAFVPGSDVFTLTVATSAASPQGTPVTITASITSATSDPDPDDNSNQLTIFLVWQSNLSVTKTGPASAFAGTAITYTIAIANPGPSNAADLTVTDTFAAPLRFVGITAPGWACVTPAVGSAGTVSCTNPQIPVGTTSLTLGLDTSPSAAPTSVTNDVSVSASTDPAGPRLASATTQLTASADLTIAKSSAPTTPVAGQAIVYTITIVQNGPSDAANVTLTDPLPSAVLFQSITAPGWSCTTPAVGASGPVSCARTPLLAGSYTITIQGTVSPSTPAGTAVSNTATVTSDTPDPTLPNTATASGMAATQADLTLAKSASPTTPVAGQTIVYTITIGQTGPSDAANVTLTDPLPSAVLFQSITAPGWPCTTPPAGASGAVTCTRTSLAAGSYTITIDGTVSPSTPAGTTVTNTASVTSSTPDPTLPNTATAGGTTTAQADLSITITDSPDPVAAGGSLTYQVVVTNGGPSDAINPSMSVLLDAALQFSTAAAPPGWTCTTPAVGASGTVACSAATIASGAVASFTIVTSVRSGPGAVTLSASATTSSSTPDPNAANNSASAITAIGAAAIPTLSDLVFVALAALLALVAVLKLGAARSGRA